MAEIDLSLLNVYQNNALSIGNTPLVQIKKVNAGKALILAKVEGRNPAFSVKDRVGLALIEDAKARGVLKPGVEIIEPTSGNTGIALAFISAVQGYKLTLSMPESMSIERQKVLKMLGANLLLTPAAKGMAGAIEAANNLLASDPEKYFMPQQFENPANPAIHARTTAPEIWQALKNTSPAAIVAGVGTGGTISGIARYFKETQKQNLQIVAVEPASSPVISQHLAGEAICPGKHAIQGIGAGFVPKNLDLNLVDRVEKISSEEALEYAKRLAKEEGLLVGISSGAAMAAANRLSQEAAFAEQIIVCILPDAGERYLSSALYADL